MLARQTTLFALALIPLAAVVQPASADPSGTRCSLIVDGPGTAEHSIEPQSGVSRLVLRGVTLDSRVRIESPRLMPDEIVVDGSIGAIALPSVNGTSISVAGTIGTLSIEGDACDLSLHGSRRIGCIRVNGDLESVLIATAGHLDSVEVAGDVTGSVILAGVDHVTSFELTTGVYRPATIGVVSVQGSVTDSVIAAGGDPGPDGLFQDGDVLAGGEIESLTIGGRVIGRASPHVNPGIYAATIGTQHIDGHGRATKREAALATDGSAVIDPLPSDSAALTVARIKRIVERAVSRANQLGVKATISIIDREGNILAVVRMNGAKKRVRINAGGRGGLEPVDNILFTSVIATTKAGTAAFLSTSKGNAFTTRTAGFIVQTHFPPGISFRPGGPLFGVQLSSLPTSDTNRLPLGLAADPGGLPLYRNNQLVGGIGVEVNGVYTVDPTRIGGATTDEEDIALAGQVTFTPPSHIRADQILLDGIRFDYANGEPPPAQSMNPLPDYDTMVGGGDLVELLAPRETPVGPTGRSSIFKRTSLGGIMGEVPDASRAPQPSGDMNDPGAPGALGVDFFDESDGSFAFVAGDVVDGERLTVSDVRRILKRAHRYNHRLRAAIRRDNPKRSQVTASVVDQNGNLLGAFRTPDAPVFGYDVSVQKARTAAFFSRTDAAAEMRRLDDKVDITALQMLETVDPSVSNPYERYVIRARNIGVQLDGSVAVADRTGGFLSRPNLPDGIDHAPPGPFTALAPDAFSPFNTGLQTTLILPRLVEFILDFNAVDESMALARFTNAVIGDGSGVVPLAGNAGALNPGGGLPGNSLANGMQIFAGSVPLYKDGVLVGGIGVSGDGIEQDDAVAFTGATGYQEFGPGVQRADEVFVSPGIRLPYIKFPRAPFLGQ